jgi:translation initiation factor IF-1
MPDGDSLKHQALVVEKLPKALFRVELVGGRRILARVSGLLRLKFTRILPGHRVMVSVSPYDLNQGTITQRLPESPENNLKTPSNDPSRT